MFVDLLNPYMGLSKHRGYGINSKFTEVLPLLGFVASQSDTSLFMKQHKGVVVIMLLYVDNIILTRIQ